MSVIKDIICSSSTLLNATNECFGNVDNFTNNNNNNNNNKNNKNKNNNNNNNNNNNSIYRRKNPLNSFNNKYGVNSFLFLLMILLFQIILCVVPVVLIAINCNPDSPFLSGVLAFLFDRLYLFQFAIRKYILGTIPSC